MCLCIVLKVYGGHKYLFSFNIKASNIEWVLNCDTYSPCSLGVPIYPPSPTAPICPCVYFQTLQLHEHMCILAY